jgi:hypothetical protein
MLSATGYFVFVGLAVFALLMLFKPFRGFVLYVFGASSVYSLIWSFFSSLFVAHWTVIRNFMPRNFVLPTLDDRKTTNAED